jgi:hypothetical protein
MSSIGWNEARIGNEHLTSSGGLALVGPLLRRCGLADAFDRLEPTGRPDRTNGGTIVSSLCGLIALGNLDYDRIEEMRLDPAFARSLGLSKVPSSPTLRQRAEDLFGATWSDDDAATVAAREERCLQAEEIARDSMARLHAASGARATPIRLPESGMMVPVDVDTTVMEELYGTKEGVGWTYQKVLGYTPNIAYIGAEGYIFDAELRPGPQHSQKGTPEAISRARMRRDQFVPPATRLIWRFDGGCDSAETVQTLEEDPRDGYIIVHNRRKESLVDWLKIAKRRGERSNPRPGKTVWIGEVQRFCGTLGRRRCVFRVTKRTTDAKGQSFIEPQIEVRLFWTNLPDAPAAIIDCYADHGTSEQFHSEYKTDLGMEQFPSADQRVNRVLFQLGCLVYNILRLLGQESLRTRGIDQTQRAPIGNRPQRRRIRSVMDDLIRVAARVISSGRGWCLSLGVDNSWAGVWLRLWHFVQPRLTS